MDLSIIIVNYKQIDFLKECLDSIYINTKQIGFEVIIIDNNSDTFKTEKKLTEFKKIYDNLDFKINRENLGFAKANNIGFLKSSGDFLIFLNPDAIILNNSLETLVGFLKSNPDAGACAPRILNPDLSFQISFNEFPTLSKIFLRTIGINKFLLKRKKLFNFLARFKKIFPGFVNTYNSNFSQILEPKEVPWITGACISVKRLVFINSGLFDENYKLYCEDMDLCLSIRKSNYKIFFVPDAKIIHFKGWTKRNLDVINYHYQSYRYYYNKNFRGVYKNFLIFFNSLEWGWEKLLLFSKSKRIDTDTII